MARARELLAGRKHGDRKGTDTPRQTRAAQAHRRTPREARLRGPYPYGPEALGLPPHLLLAQVCPYPLDQVPQGLGAGDDVEGRGQGAAFLKVAHPELRPRELPLDVRVVLRRGTGQLRTGLPGNTPLTPGERPLIVPDDGVLWRGATVPWSLSPSPLPHLNRHLKSHLVQEPRVTGCAWRGGFLPRAVGLQRLRCVGFWPPTSLELLPPARLCECRLRGCSRLSRPLFPGRAQLGTPPWESPSAPAGDRRQLREKFPRSRPSRGSDVTSNLGVAPA